MRFYKCVALAVAVIMLLGMLSACAGSTPPASAPEASQGTQQAQSGSAQPDAAQSALDPVTIKLHFPDYKKPMYNEVWAQIAEKTKDKLNATFEITFTGWDDYANKIQLLSASGDNFDGYFDANWLIYTQMMTKGALLDITDMIGQYMPQYSKRLNDIGMIDPILVGGRLYAVPWDVPKSERTIFAYRSDLAEKYGVDMSNINTIEDVEPYFEAIKQNEPDMTPTYWDRGSGANFFTQVIRCFMHKYNLDMVGDGFVYALDDPECKIVPFEQHPAFRDAMLLIRSWYDKEYISRNMSTTWEEDIFITGKCGSSWAFAYGTNVPFQNVSGATAKTIPMYRDNLAASTSPLGNLFCINKNAANPERLLMFIELLSNDQEVYDMVMYGIEGETYVLDGEMAIPPPGMDIGNTNYLDWSGQWGWWRWERLRPTASDTAETYRLQEELQNWPTQINGKLTSFIPEPEAISTEVAKRDAVADEKMRILEFGQAEDVNAAVDDYIASQKAAGVDKLLAEMQRQVDEFIK